MRGSEQPWIESGGGVESDGEEAMGVQRRFAGRGEQAATSAAEEVLPDERARFGMRGVEIARWARTAVGVAVRVGQVNHVVCC